MKRRRRPPSRIPEVNLVPMMDVLMSVLIFFVVISMGLTGVQINGVTLPQSVSSADEAIEEAEEPDPLVIGVNTSQELVLDGAVVQFDAIDAAVDAYFAENPDGSLMVKADRNLAYEQITELLIELRSIGGRRVSLAVE